MDKAKIKDKGETITTNQKTKTLTMNKKKKNLTTLQRQRMVKKILQCP